MVEYVERYLDDERLRMALIGQGVIGTNSSPYQPGTASIHVFHSMGTMGGIPGMWGYVQGGMGMVNLPLTRTEWKDYHAMANLGQLPPRFWEELYFHTAHDPSVAPPGCHTMSIFAQYVPYTFAEGDWNSRRDEVGNIALESLGRFCNNIPNAVLNMDVMGPPDIEKKVGLTGGHIFQGEILPPYMWDQRLESRTPMPGVYLCGACTHPGGSVIAINGRNAAMEVLMTEGKE